ncbi:DHH family phosphoesterase [Brevibacillus laterosporus]|uniref:DHH family phosphoesterase n=1 Tax=Brevibacillus laterosporus TaxID=1465 RepID=UPI003D21280F
MNYKLIGTNDYIFDPIFTVLSNRGVYDIGRFLNLDESVCIPYKKLENIDRAVKCTMSHIENKSKIFIMVDSDVDGYTSASILYQYIKKLSPEIHIEWAVHDGKGHGISNIDIPFDVSLVFVPDAGSNDFEKHKELKAKGIDVIVLDHHEIEEESEDAIVVNTRLGDYDNNNLSGAGVVYKFCKAIDAEMWLDYADQFLDLVALGNISDLMSMKELETRFLVDKGLKNVSNSFFLALINQQSFSIKGRINIINISFYIAPLINATIRYGTQQDKEDMFRAFIEEQIFVPYKPRGSIEEKIEPLAVNMARRCYNLRSKQNRDSAKITETLENKIEIFNLDVNSVIVIDAKNDLSNKNITGLIANKIASKYKKPVILFSSCDKDIYTGSARGYDKGELKDFKKVVLDTQLFEYALGHSNAYGVGIKESNLNAAISELNSKLVNYSFEDCPIVDFDIHANKLEEEFIYTIYRNGNIWGKGIEEPLILIREVPVTIGNTEIIGKQKNVMKIDYLTTTYLIFKANEDILTNFKTRKSKFINVIGRAHVNKYLDVTYPQIIVEAYELI